MNNPDYRVNFFLMTIMWGCISFGNYLIVFQLKYIKGNVYLNAAAGGGAAAAGNLLSGVFLTLLGRKHGFFTCFLLGGLGAFLLLFVSADNVELMAAFVLLSEFGVVACFGMVYGATPRMFPPEFGARTFGFMNIFARIMTIFAPVVAELEAPIPMLLLTIFCGISSTAALFLREVP